MKPHSLTKTVLAALMLSTASQASPALKSKISAKEKEIVRLQAELTQLKSQLSKSDSKTYTVQTGDTLSSIARRHGLTPSALIKLNKLKNPSKLLVGQTLKIKQAQATSETSRLKTPKQTAKTYTVKRGDTFYSIARRHRISVSKLQKLNPDVTANRIARGQKIVVKAISEKPVTVAKAQKKIESGVQLISTSTKAPRAKKETKVEKKKAPVAKNTGEKKAFSLPPVEKPAPKKEVKKETKTPSPIPTEKKEPEAKPATTPAPEPTPASKEKEETSSQPTSPVTSIILTSQTTFDAFATKHSTSTDVLNELNGWNLPKGTTLARGSEIYVPKQ